MKKGSAKSSKKKPGGSKVQSPAGQSTGGGLLSSFESTEDGSLPPRTTTPRQAKIVAALEPLKEHPGEWFKVGIYSKKSASPMARAAKNNPALTGFSFTTRTERGDDRTPTGRSELWAGWKVAEE